VGEKENSRGKRGDGIDSPPTDQMGCKLKVEGRRGIDRNKKNDVRRGKRRGEVEEIEKFARVRKK